MSLNGKIALVTGSSRAIGRAISLELGRRGADVALHYFRNRGGAEATRAELEQLGVRAVTVKAHFKNNDQIEALFQEVESTLGGLDILVFNAASAVFRPVLEVDEQGWDWTMKISAESALRCAQYAVPLMEARGGGRIVTTSSLGSERTLDSYDMAGIAKAALESLTRYLAVQLAPRNIIVNAVAPGAVQGDEHHWELHPKKDETAERMLQRTPLGRFPTAEDVAKVVCFLSSDDAGCIVGQTIKVDGGFSHVC